MMGTFIPVAQVQAQALLDPVAVRQAAQAVLMDSLTIVPIPEPPNLQSFLRPNVNARTAAIQLGKALFWDMQVGSDGQACATCHFHAGADSRAKNQLTTGNKNTDLNFNPPLGATGWGPNYTLGAGDFPFTVWADPEDENFLTRVLVSDTNDVVSSQGAFNALFDGVVATQSFDLGTALPDLIYNVGGVNVRKVEPRNTPTMINAVFNFSNFWDGRAHNMFNGESVIGPLDGTAGIWVEANGVLTKKKVSIPNASLASQAVGPPLSDFEMSFIGRSFPELGRKMLSLRPLALQHVHPLDSVLGPISRARLRNGQVIGSTGLRSAVTYEGLIKAAFRPKYWASAQLTPDGFTQMEANFALFFGLAVQIYEATLVSDQTPYDRFMDGDDFALTQEQLRGLLVFINFGDPTQVAGGQFADLFAGVGRGACVPCHFAAEFTSASVRVVSAGPVEMDFVPQLVNGFLVPTDPLVLEWQDESFYNIGVRPTSEDLGRGARINGIPLSFTQQAIEGYRLPFAVLRPDPEFPGQLPINNRASTAGKFKVPGLRNVELTGPYFHNGGQATLAQVLEFYDRKGDFSDRNVEDIDGPLTAVALGVGDEDALIALMLSLTDERVRMEMAPFDHPELFVPNGHPGDHVSITEVNTIQAADSLLRVPPVGTFGREAQGLAPIGPFLGIPQLPPAP